MSAGAPELAQEQAGEAGAAAGGQHRARAGGGSGGRGGRRARPLRVRLVRCARSAPRSLRTVLCAEPASLLLPRVSSQGGARRRSTAMRAHALFAEGKNLGGGGEPAEQQTFACLAPGRGHMENQELARPANAAFVSRPPHRCGVADGERASVRAGRAALCMVRSALPFLLNGVA